MLERVNNDLCMRYTRALKYESTADLDYTGGSRLADWFWNPIFSQRHCIRPHQLWALKLRAQQRQIAGRGVPPARSDETVDTQK